MLFPITSLLNIVRYKTLLEGAKKVFYNDQKHVRVCQLNEEIDEAWVAEQLVILEHQLQEQHITDYVFSNKNVLPSARTLNDYKQLLAVQPEADAANALFTVMYNVQCT